MPRTPKFNQIEAAEAYDSPDIARNVHKFAAFLGISELTAYHYIRQYDLQSTPNPNPELTAYHSNARRFLPHKRPHWAIELFRGYTTLQPPDQYARERGVGRSALKYHLSRAIDWLWSSSHYHRYDPTSASPAQFIEPITIPAVLTIPPQKPHGYVMTPVANIIIDDPALIDRPVKIAQMLGVPVESSTDSTVPTPYERIVAYTTDCLRHYTPNQSNGNHETLQS